MGYRVLAFLVSYAFAYAETTPRDFYQAIRENDLAKIKGYLSAGAAADLRDTRGTTPLMHAASIGSLEAMQMLIKAGADVNAKNGLDATPLVWAAANAAKAKLLIDAGAQVNVRTKMMRTPLMMAASAPDNASTVKLMIDKGADVTVADVRGHTALVDAARANNTEALRLLLDHKQDVNAGDFGGVTALGHAAAHSNIVAVKMLLAKGADPNTAMKRELKVRNGLIAASYFTPLMAAVARSSIDTVRLLLDAGADVKKQDVRGMTPLMLAVASDVANPAVVRLLIERGSDLNARSVDGETALDWAGKFGNPRVLSLLGGTVSGSTAAVKQTSATVRDARGAMELAMPLLTSSAKEYFRMSGCGGCHHQHVIGMAVPAAEKKGVAVDPAFRRDQLQIMKGEVMGNREALLQDIFISVDGLAFAMLGMGEQQYPADELTDAMVSAIAARQNEEGDFIHFPFVRPPLEDSPFVSSALAIRTISRYAIPARKTELEGRIAKTRQWFLASKPAVPYERAFQVLGLHWSGAERAAVQRAVSELRKLQRADGGFAQLATLPSDAFATATALYALAQAGIPAKDAAYQRGVRFLLTTQKPDGSWHVASRAPKVQPYFQSGFPYDHDQWISAASTAWAVTALAEAAEPPRQSASLRH
ncbi:MAG: ankyrin repeat domain-containing protein [Bryobacterales bacterium]|nr:ankyrin repeat domain-containing protein [Bryobacterales bacterium]